MARVGVNRAELLKKGAVMTIRPESGISWYIMNVYSPKGKPCTFQVGNDTAWIQAAEFSGPLRLGSQLTHQFYARVINSSGDEIPVGFDGFADLPDIGDPKPMDYRDPNEYEDKNELTAEGREKYDTSRKDGMNHKKAMAAAKGSA